MLFQLNELRKVSKTEKSAEKFHRARTQYMPNFAKSLFLTYSLNYGPHDNTKKTD